MLKRSQIEINRNSPTSHLFVANERSRRLSPKVKNKRNRQKVIILIAGLILKPERIKNVYRLISGDNNYKQDVIRQI